MAFASTSIPAQLGQSAKVYIAGAERSPLSVPLSAVTVSAVTAEQGQAYVWRVGRDHRVQRAPVRIGPYGAESVPVLAGLDAGDWVVAAGGHVLREGQEVRPVDRSNRGVDLAAKE